MRICWLFIMLALCSCRSSPPVQSTEAKPEVLAAVAQAIDSGYVPKSLPFVLSPKQQEYLKAVTISDPSNMVHPRHYDRIRSIESRQVERFYLNYTGEVSRSEVITLPEDEFWLPLKLLAQYYSKFGRLPVGTNLSVPMMKGALAQKVKHQSTL